MAITLEKRHERFQYFRNADERPTEYELAWRRWGKGARVSAEWGYYLRNNDLRELHAFYQDSARKARR